MLIPSHIPLFQVYYLYAFLRTHACFSFLLLLLFFSLFPFFYTLHSMPSLLYQPLYAILHSPRLIHLLLLLIPLLRPPPPLPPQQASRGSDGRGFGGSGDESVWSGTKGKQEFESSSVITHQHGSVGRSAGRLVSREG